MRSICSLLSSLDFVSTILIVGGLRAKFWRMTTHSFNYHFDRWPILPFCWFFNMMPSSWSVSWTQSSRSENKATNICFKCCIRESNFHSLYMGNSGQRWQWYLTSMSKWNGWRNGSSARLTRMSLPWTGTLMQCLWNELVDYFWIVEGGPTYTLFTCSTTSTQAALHL